MLYFGISVVTIGLLWEWNLSVPQKHSRFSACGIVFWWMCVPGLLLGKVQLQLVCRELLIFSPIMIFFWQQTLKIMFCIEVRCWCSFATHLSPRCRSNHFLACGWSNLLGFGWKRYDFFKDIILPVFYWLWSTSKVKNLKWDDSGSDMFLFLFWIHLIVQIRITYLYNEHVIDIQMHEHMASSYIFTHAWTHGFLQKMYKCMIDHNSNNFIVVCSIESRKTRIKLN